MLGSDQKTQNSHFIAAAGFYKSVLGKLADAEKKDSGGDEKWCFDHPPKILSTVALDVRVEKENKEKCQSLWSIRPKNEVFSKACWEWFFAEVVKQKDIQKDSPAWRHLVQYASEYVFANIFQKLPDDFFEPDSLESKSSVSEPVSVSEAEGIALSASAIPSTEPALDKTAIKQEMERLISELALGFLEELNKQAALSEKKKFSYWNSLIAALSATIIMALLTIVLVDSAAMLALVLAFHSAPVFCSATFLIVFLVCELMAYFVLTPFFTDPSESLKLKLESAEGSKKLLVFSHHAFLCGALFTLTALMMLGIASASPGVSVLVAICPGAAGLLVAGGPALLAIVAFLSGVALVGFGYLCAMGWKWCREDMPLVEILPDQSPFVPAGDLLGESASLK